MGRRRGGRRRNRRRYINVERLWEQEGRQQQQERALDAEEADLLQRQLYVTQLSNRVQGLEAAIRDAFSWFGRVIGVVLKHQTIRPASGRQPFKVPTAVVEFESAEGAAAALAAAQDTAAAANRGALQQQQLVLSVGSIGHLRLCGCGGYLRVQRNRPARSRSSHRGRAGCFERSGQQLQLGSKGPDGITLISELDLADCCVEFDLQRRCLSLAGPVARHLGDSGNYCLEVAFRHLRHSLRLDCQQRSLDFTMRQPPKVLHKTSAILQDIGRMPEYTLSLDPTTPKQTANSSQRAAFTDDSNDSDSLGSLVDDLGRMIDLFRGTVFGRGCSASCNSSSGSGLAGADGLLGRCFSLRLLLSHSFVSELTPDGKLFKKLRSFRLLSTVRQQQGELVSRSSWEARHGPCALPEVLQQLPFELRYHVLLLLSAGVATIWQVSARPFQDLLLQHGNQQQQRFLLCQALAELSAAAAPVRDCTAAVKELLESLTYLQQQQLKDAAAAGSVAAAGRLFKVLRAHLTPTRLKVLQLEEQTGNRVVRHFCSPEAGSRSYCGDEACLSWLQFSASHFLRLSFGDEGGDRLFGGNREQPIDVFWQRMTDGLRQGVVIGGRRFAFLAYSSSQLKSWSCWMVADPQQDEPGAAGAAAIAAALRTWMGDAMKTERVPAKCAARLGQCFSATVDGAQLQWQQEVGCIADVERADSGGTRYCFSDGVGRICPELLQQVLDSLDYVNPATPVSAVQVRFGGCKGVFCRYDGDMAGMQLQYRPSQQKFGSQHPALEVCGVAAWLPAYLNRQVILMMHHNGVPEQVFLNKQHALLDSLAEMCRSPTAALALLPALGGIETGAQAAMLQLLQVCVSCKLPMGPLLGSCLEAAARWQVTDLRTKARLLVQQGATLMGVMDEYDLLQEDEVFVQVRPRGSDSSTRRIITGPVMLAKHPVAHRGDVRLVTAVDPAASSSSSSQVHLLADTYVNVVVFSQKGQRPLPNKLSGSDLDGDLYHVHWDPQLLPPYTREPMDYSAEPPEKVDCITPQHLQDHFVNFAKNDNLGMISTWLLAQADRKGADCRACEQLAELHSMAVGFPKTGRPAEISPEELRQLRPEEYPHWMEKRDSETYTPETVLYDAVLAHPAAVLCSDAFESSTASLGNGQQQGEAVPWPKQLLQVAGISPGYRSFLEPAELQFALFEQDLVALMNRWQVYDVGQMVTGCLPRLQRQQQKHQHSEQRDQVNRELCGVFGRARAAFLCLLLQQPEASAATSSLSSVRSGYGPATAQRLEDLPVKQLQQMLDDAYGSSSSSSGNCNSGGGSAAVGQQQQQQQVPQPIDDRHRCAAAFMCVAHKNLVSAAVLYKAGAGPADAEAQADDASDDEDVYSGSVESDDSEDNDEAVPGIASAGSKEQEIRQLVRLCFQFVVPVELAQLTRWVPQQV